MDNSAEIRNLNKKMSTKFEISDMNFDLKAGFVTGLVGANGSGKTTLIRLLMGNYVKDSGEVTYFGQRFEDFETEIKKKIGYVPDVPLYFDDFNLKYNAQMIAPFYDNFDFELYNKYLADFELNEDHKFKELSKGNKMKFALAMVLSHKPEILILDEPVANVDPIFRHKFVNLIYDFISDGKKSVLFSTHITSDLDKVADYIIFIDNGKIIFNGEKDLILAENENRSIEDLIYSYKVKDSQTL